MNLRKLSFALLVFFIFTIPWEDSVSLGSLGSVSRLVGLAAMGCMLISWFETRRIRKFHPFYVFVVLFLVWNIASILWTIDITLTRRRISTFIQLALLSWLIWDQTETKIQLNLLLEAYVLGTFISIGGTIYNFIIGKEAFLYSGGRYAANGFNADDLAIIIALALPLAWYLIISYRPEDQKRWWVPINLVFIPAAYFALILTGSRAGFLCSLAAFAYFIVTLGKLKVTGRVLFFLCIAASLVVVFNVIPVSTLTRIANTFSDIQNTTWGGRLVVYQDAGKIINAHPLAGIGSGVFASASSLGSLAHNSFLSVLSETGSIGFFIFFLVLLITFIESWQQPQQEKFLWLTSLLVWGIGAFSVSWEFRKPTWILLSFIITSSALYPIHKSVKQEDENYQQSILPVPAKSFLKGKNES